MPKKGTRISRLAEAAEQAGLSYSTVWHRLKRGASMEEALDADLHVPRVLINSGYRTISALASEARLPYDIVKQRRQTYLCVEGTGADSLYSVCVNVVNVVRIALVEPDRLGKLRYHGADKLWIFQHDPFRVFA